MSHFIKCKLLLLIRSYQLSGTLLRTFSAVVLSLELACESLAGLRKMDSWLHPQLHRSRSFPMFGPFLPLLAPPLFYFFIKFIYFLVCLQGRDRGRDKNLPSPG